MKLRPLHDRVIVKRLEQETKTASGIVIPDNAAEKPDQGEVLAVGPGKRNDKGDFVALNIKVGDRVLFGRRPLRRRRKVKLLRDALASLRGARNPHVALLRSGSCAPCA
jgi:chaperonin GroES